MALIRLEPNSPLINNFRYATGDLAGKPLDAGTIDFFEDANRTTRQNTYSDPTQLVLNPNPLVASDVGTLPPIYMLQNPYYIVIKDKFGNVVATLENYVPGGGGSSGGSAINTDNIFPSLGFDSQVFSDIYNVSGRSLSSGLNPFSLGWIWDIDTSNTSSSNYYTFTPLDNSGIDGNPRNFATFFSSNNSTGDARKRIYAKIGGYNSWQDIQLQLAVNLRLIVGGFTTLAVSLFRTKQGVPQAPISIGSVTVPSASLDQVTTTFTVPVLTDSGYANNDGLFLEFDLPLNQDFQLQMTGTWLQESPDEKLNISEENHGTDIAKMLWNLNNQIESAEYNKTFGGLPVITTKSGLQTNNVTGFVEIGTADIQVSGYHRINDNVELIASTVEAPAAVGVQGVFGDTLNDRLINFLRGQGLAQSVHTFIATKVSTNQLDWATGIGTKEKTTWVANAGGRVTLTKATNELIYHLKCAHKNNKVTFTFTDNFAPGIIPHNAIYLGTAGTLTGNLYVTLPTSHPIVNWIGDSEQQNQRSAPNFYEANNRFIFKEALHVSTIALGSGSTPAIVEMEIPDNNLDKRHAATRYDFGNVGAAAVNPSAYLPTPIAWEIPAYTYESVTHYHALESNDGSPHAATASFFSGFLSYNSTGTNPATQPYSPPRMIKFRVNGVSNALAGVDSTAEVDVTSGMTGREVAKAISDTINSKFKYDMLFTALPQNGDYVTISNGITDYTVLWYDTALAKPANPTGNRIIFVEFVGTQTIEQVRDLTSTTVGASQTGIPLPQDFGLLIDPTFTYYMHA